MKRLLLGLLPLLISGAVRAQAPADTFYLNLHVKGPGVDTLMRLRAPGGAIHAVLPTASRRGGARGPLQRLESAAIYRRNYLAGEGLTLQFIQVLPLGWGPKRAKWLRGLLRPGTLSTAEGTADPELFRQGGVELKYRDPRGGLYRAAHGSGGKASVVIEAVERRSGEALGGFGQFSYVVRGTLSGIVVSREGVRLAIWGDFKLGLIAPEE